MRESAPDDPGLSDDELDELYAKIQAPDPDEDIRDDVVRARAALKMIHQVRDLANPSTHKVQETKGGRTTYSETGGELEVSLPERIGRFEIKQVIGKGGFGMVLLAHDPNLGRDVALKIPRPEVITTPDLKSRFLREGRAAAALAHPNIVPVYESGQIESICFLASQYVKGETLSHWMSGQQSVSVSDAVMVCHAVSEALAHAHQRGVLHRDIKPSNVMVKANVAGQELAERIQITDFGLAKDLSEDSAQTQTGALIGTPAYMSPEQAGQKVATQASDIYSVGALLYELLTGKPPFVGDNIVETIQEVIHASPRSPRKLNPQVPADLEAICLKCLEKQPESRYPTAVELRLDLERFLRGEPVKARRVTTVTRVAKWITRNRLAASLLVVLTAGTLGTSFGMIRAQRAQSEARLAEADAKLEARTALRVADFLVELFEVPDATRAGKGSLHGREITAREILDLGSEKIRGNLNEEPEIQARLMATMGRVYNNLGLYAQAEINLKAALDLQMEILEAGDSDIARTHIQLGKVYRRKDRFDDAMGQIEQAMEILEQDIAANHDDLSRAYNEVGLLLRNQDADAAQHAYQQARDLVATFKGGDHESLWQIDANLAGIDARAGRYKRARDWYERALNGGIRSLGEDNPRLGKIMSNLAYVHRKLGNYQLALTLQEKDLKLIEKHLGPDHDEMFGALSGLATTCKRLGDFESAKLHGARAVTVAQKSLPPDHRYIWLSLNNYAETLSRSRDYFESRQQIMRAIECLQRREGDQVEFNRLASLNLLCRTERLAGNRDEALAASEVAVAHPALDEKRSLAFETHINRAQLFAYLKHNEAEAALDDAIASAEGSNVSPQSLAHGQARFWALAGDPERAMTKLEAAFELGYRDIYVLTDPDFDPIRKTRRFGELAKKINAAAKPQAP